jgi:hypothetical protein
MLTDPYISLSADTPAKAGSATGVAPQRVLEKPDAARGNNPTCNPATDQVVVAQ